MTRKKKMLKMISQHQMKRFHVDRSIANFADFIVKIFVSAFPVENTF